MIFKSHYLTISINLIIIIHIDASTKSNSVDNIKKSLEEHQGHLLVNKSKTKSVPLKIANVTQIKFVPPVIKKKKNQLKLISPKSVEDWAKEISDELHMNEAKLVRRDVLLKGFSDIKIEIRDGAAIVEKTAKALEDLLERRGRAAESIMQKAEELSTDQKKVPKSYRFVNSIDLDVMKKEAEEDVQFPYVLPVNCSSLNKVKLQNRAHFDAQVSMETSSAHIAAEVFECDNRVIQHIYWSEGLLSTFRDNYAQDATLEFQYFCSAKGFMRHYPAALWSSMYKVKIDGEELYDCRLRPWYVSASGAPRDVLILLDASGSMSNSSNLVVSQQFTLALLSALTDDDQVNVLRFNVVVESPIPCFNEKLVPANHVNSAAMMSALQYHITTNETKMEHVLAYSVNLLNKQRELKERPPSCQQAIIMLTDSLYANFTEYMANLDPEGRIRLFVLWLHDPNGLRDSTRLYGQATSCARDGYFAELTTHADVTEQVMRVLRVLERPLVAQRKRRLRVLGDVYANVEDPRRSEYYWQQKENVEQVHRYTQLRKNKDRFINNARVYSDDHHLERLNKLGQYYEGEDINYRLKVSISVPVFENTNSENITITLDEEKQRNSTRTYPVNRLLGVAGVDIPIDHLKLILPYYLVGSGGSLFLIDHRGNIVLHENSKPVFDGDILKPGYRTVDFLDIEQAGVDHLPRHFPAEWLEFRNNLVIKQPRGNKTMYAKTVFESGMRTLLEHKDYFWRRVMDHYTVVVTLPKYNTKHAVPDATFSQQLAEEALRALHGTEFAINPDWLYCQHIDPSFDSREAEVLHFLRRRRDEPAFVPRKTFHMFSPIKPALLDKTYQCNTELMARLSAEAVATYEWTRVEADAEHPCPTCQLGSVTAFFAGESGLTRWQQHHATSGFVDPPDGGQWSRGPAEGWYRRATAASGTLVVHVPVAPVRLLRNSFIDPPPLGERYQWLTAARTLGTAKGIVGVAGYHFHQRHLDALLDAVTSLHCDEDDDCEPHCDGKIWSCVLVDEEGWIVSRVAEEGEEDGGGDEEELREHLALAHPAAMAALLNASVFKLRWVHDYQAVCFPPKDEEIISAAPTLSSIMLSLWRWSKLILHLGRELLTILAILSKSELVRSDTEYEKEKRRNRLKKDYEREKYERLYDPRVLVTRTRFAACDRSRALYELQRTPKAMEQLTREPEPCAWPLAGAALPGTNLLLLAVYRACPHAARPLNDPFVNQQVAMEVDRRQSSAALMACWRTRVALPARTPRTACFPHNYSAEAGYRQCGPWLPDPEEENSSNHIRLSTSLLIIYCLYYFYVQHELN